MDPRRILASPELLELVETISRRTFKDQNLADACYLHILDELEKDDCMCLRNYKERSSLKTFLYSVITKRAIDYKRELFGRLRVPDKIADEGPLAVKVYSLIYFKGYSLRDSYSLLKDEDGYTRSYPDFLEEMKSVLKPPTLERAPTFHSLEDEAFHLAETLPHSDPNPLEAMIESADDEQREKILAVIREAAEELSDQDQALLRFAYVSDLKLAAVARMLGLPDGVARRRLEAIMTTFRKKLLAQGIRNQ